MVFSSLVFLFLFLPLVLLIYHVVAYVGHATAWWGVRAGNVCLLFFSLIFYAWGEPLYVALLMASILIDYFCGLLISGALGGRPIQRLPKEGARTAAQKFGICVSVGSSLTILGFFKYFNFGVESCNSLSGLLGLSSIRVEHVINVALPVGVSFYTFQAMSYTIDVYRGQTRATRSLIDFSCYVTMFPQLVAGPIVRYQTIAAELPDRAITRALFAEGIRRFCVGLGKKVLIANTVAVTADKIFALPPEHLTADLAWIGLLAYTIQIYFDFSGYSDMAVGMGRMFGFHFPENFNYPYAARSLQDFWRRWHITLSTWFRDYLYIPLGGNRASAARVYFNLIVVFFLCGLWHGAAWTFVVWGLFHGLFLILERVGLGRWLDLCWAPLRHAYVLAVVMLAWVIFRSDSLTHALIYLRALCGLGVGVHGLPVPLVVTNDVWLALLAGALASTPVFVRSNFRLPPVWVSISNAAAVAGYAAILFVSVLFLAAGTHNPFIYYRF